MLRHLKNLIRRILGQPTDCQRVEARPHTQEQNPGGPNYIPIESHFELVHIPGTNSYLGHVIKIMQMEIGELVTLSNQLGVLLGCGHSVDTLERIVTPHWTREGLGGCCNYCAQENALLFAQDKLTLEQLQLKSRYCTACQGKSCHGCGRRDLCVRHSLAFQYPDGRTVYLCPSCMAKEEEKYFFNTAMQIMLLPFLEDREPPSENRRDHDHQP